MIDPVGIFAIVSATSNGVGNSISPRPFGSGATSGFISGRNFAVHGTRERFMLGMAIFLSGRRLSSGAYECLRSLGRDVLELSEEKVHQLQRMGRPALRMLTIRYA